LEPLSTEALGGPGRIQKASDSRRIAQFIERPKSSSIRNSKTKNQFLVFAFGCPHSPGYPKKDYDVLWTGSIGIVQMGSPDKEVF